MYIMYAYRDLHLFWVGEHTEHESSEQLLTELLEGVRAPWNCIEASQISTLLPCILIYILLRWFNTKRELINI